jgi:hypothetical protein
MFLVAPYSDFSQAEKRMMKEIEEMSSDDDEASAVGADDDDEDVDDVKEQKRSVRNKRVASSDLRSSGRKKGSAKSMGGSTFASADAFGDKVDEWHSQLVQVHARVAID